MTEIDEQTPELNEIETTDLVHMIMEQVETVKQTKDILKVVTRSAREIQIELSHRGLKMEFEELSSPLSGGEIRLTPEIPSPGLTEALPEFGEQDQDAPLMPSQPDVRSEAQIQKDSQLDPQAAARDAATFETDAAFGYQQAFEQGMKQAARKMAGSK